MPIVTRVFVVGCPRSGTTLVQSLLAAHPDVASFPETHFFHRLRAFRLRFPRPHVVRGDERRTLEDLLGQIGRPDLVTRLPEHASARGWIDVFVRTLDAVAEDAGATVWVEKTPGHLGYVDRIAKTVPHAHFVHIVRRGPDVVASMVEASRAHPEGWGGARQAEDAAKRWLRDVAKTEACAGEAAHVVVCYERLVADPGGEATRLCEALGLAPAASLVDDRASAAEGLVGEDERWKAGVFEEVRSAPAGKFETLLSPEERRRVLAILGDAESRREALCR